MTLMKKSFSLVWLFATITLIAITARSSYVIGYNQGWHEGPLRGRHGEPIPQREPFAKLPEEPDPRDLDNDPNT